MLLRPIILECFVRVLGQLLFDFILSTCRCNHMSVCNALKAVKKTCCNFMFVCVGVLRPMVNS